MSIRQFTLINANGYTYDITSTEALFHDPSGLGYKRSETYRQIGDSFILVNRQVKQQTISGSLLFTQPGAYQKYFDFIQFCAVEPLTLVYQTTGTAYRRTVHLTDVDKTELDHDYGYLDVELTFTCLAPWYRTVSVQPKQSEVDVTNLWPRTWPFVWSAGSAGTIELDSDSYMDSPCKITIKGPCKNPVWRHYVDGILHETGSIKCQFEAGSYLIIDNTTYPYTLAVYNQNGEMVQNVYQLSDFSTQRFVNLQHGHNILAISAESANSSEIRLDSNLYYESV